jgi:hypothetical protein
VHDPAALYARQQQDSIAAAASTLGISTDLSQ